jgi:hypothetical protein
MCGTANSGRLKTIQYDNNPEGEFFALQKKNNGILFAKSQAAERMKNKSTSIFIFHALI